MSARVGPALRLGTAWLLACAALLIAAPHAGAVLFYDSQWGGQGTGNGQFDFPEGVAVAPSGDIYVADTANNRIQHFDAAGNFIGKWGSPGNQTGQLRPAGRRDRRPGRQRLRRRLRQQPGSEIRPHRHVHADLHHRAPELHQYPERCRSGRGRERLHRRHGQQPCPEVLPEREQRTDLGPAGNGERPFQPAAWHHHRLGGHCRLRHGFRQQSDPEVRPQWDVSEQVGHSGNRERAVQRPLRHRDRLGWRRLCRGHRQQPDPAVQPHGNLHRQQRVVWCRQRGGQLPGRARRRNERPGLRGGHGESPRGDVRHCQWGHRRGQGLGSRRSRGLHVHGRRRVEPHVLCAR